MKKSAPKNQPMPKSGMASFRPEEDVREFLDQAQAAGWNKSRLINDCLRQYGAEVLRGALGRMASAASSGPAQPKRKSQ